MKNIIKFLAVVFIMQPLLAGLVFAQEANNEIIKAYEIRMNGEIDEAKTILSKVLENEPTNAMAHFEMARMAKGLKVKNHIDKALLNDPNNIMYHFYQANWFMLEAYKGMRGNQSTMVSDHIDGCVESLKKILEVKPDCKESLLFLVEIYGYLPNEYGGNQENALSYLNQLKEVDKLYAAQGELVFLSKDQNFDLIMHWKNYIKQYGETPDALIKLGKAQLMNNDIKGAKVTFNKVIEINPERQILHLDVARAYLYKAMRGGDKNKKDLNEFKNNINLYLTNDHKKIPIIEAWCYGWLGQIEQRQGNQAKANEYLAKAESIMPNYPKFTALPKVDNPPNVLAYNYKSYFYPY